MDTVIFWLQSYNSVCKVPKFDPGSEETSTQSLIIRFPYLLALTVFNLFLKVYQKYTINMFYTYVILWATSGISINSLLSWEDCITMHAQLGLPDKGCARSRNLMWHKSAKRSSILWAQQNMIFLWCFYNLFHQ